MGLLNWMKKGFGEHDTPHSHSGQPQIPSFEQLEPRLLLSADASIVPDLYPVETPFEVAIVVDYDMGSQIAEDGNQIVDPSSRVEEGGELAEEESHSEPENTGHEQQEASNPSGLSVSQLAPAAELSGVLQNETSPSLADASEAIYPNTQHPTPSTQHQCDPWGHQSPRSACSDRRPRFFPQS